MKNPAHQNHILNQLEYLAFNKFLTLGSWVNFEGCDSSYKTEKLNGYVYFPVSGVFALLVCQPLEKPLSISILGKNSLIGVGSCLGVSIEPCELLALTNGTAFKITSNHLYRFKLNNKKFCTSIDEYIAKLNQECAYAVICSSRHSLLQRLARLLLSYDDLSDSKSIDMTQELLAHLLGVRRSGVNKAASYLKDLKSISYSRGLIKILNRETLIKLSCACYSLKS